MSLRARRGQASEAHSHSHSHSRFGAQPEIVIRWVRDLRIAVGHFEAATR